MKHLHAIRRNLVSILLCIAVQSASLTVATPHAADGSNHLSLHASATQGSRAIRQSPVSNIQSSTSLTYTLYLPAIAYARPPLPSAGVEASGSGTSYSGQISRMNQAGAAWTRVTAVWWPDVESTEGVIDWTPLSTIDSQLIAISAQGMRPVLVVRGTPSWAQLYAGYSCGPIAQDKFTAFGDFMAALVTRYSQPPYNVKYWEMGNEPDVDHTLVATDSTYGCWGDSSDYYYGGGYYAQMLKAVYPRIKAVDPSAQVLVGGLLLDCDPRWTTAGCQFVRHSSAPSRFLEGILLGGAGPYFDGVAYHAYDYYTGVLGAYYNPNFESGSNTTGPSSAAKAGFLLSVLSTYNVSGKYLLNTESGMLAAKRDGDPAYEMTKAYYVAHLYSQAEAIGLRAIMWYSVFGWPDESDALLNTDLSARPAYTAFNAITALLGGTTYAGPVTSADVGGSAQVLGYKFMGGAGSPDGHTWIVWSANATTCTLTLTTPPQKVWDVFGNPITLVNSTTVPLFPSGQLLVYLNWTQ